MHLPIQPYYLTNSWQYHDEMVIWDTLSKFGKPYILDLSLLCIHYLYKESQGALKYTGLFQQ